MLDQLRQFIPGRDHIIHSAGLAAALITFLLANFTAFSDAFGVPLIWEKRLELISGLIGTAFAFLRMSPLPLTSKGKMRLRLTGKL